MKVNRDHVRLYFDLCVVFYRSRLSNFDKSVILSSLARSVAFGNDTSVNTVWPEWEDMNLPVFDPVFDINGLSEPEAGNREPEPDRVSDC